jgi:hypothetical protein
MNGNYGYVEPVRAVNYTNTANYQPITTAPTRVSTVQNVSSINTQNVIDEEIPRPQYSKLYNNSG